MKFHTAIHRAYNPSNQLVENKATYKQMMAGIMTALTTYDPPAAKSLADQVGYYTKLLKRSDRVVWALRWVRLDGFLDLQTILSTKKPDGYQEILPWVEKNITKYRNELQNNGGSYVTPEGVNANADTFQSARFSNSLVHFMSYTDKDSTNYIMKIDSFVFGWELPSSVIAQMERFETEWKTSRKQEIAHASDEHDDSVELISFPDGFGWWNLGVEFCTTEGKAMGHCGNNSYMREEGDQILSLRQTITRGGNRYHIPHLTFILDADEMLGEMKGRGNEKPAAKYHKYIVPLLKSDYIEGIKGGGYLPQNNFSISDLDTDVRDALVAEKPSLEPFYDKFYRLGAIPEVMDQLNSELSKVGLPTPYEIVGDTVILDQWSTLSAFASNIDFEPLQNAVDYEYDPEGIDINDMLPDFDLSIEHTAEMFEFIDYALLQKIADDVDVKGDVRDFKTRQHIALYANKSKYEEMIRRATLEAASLMDTDLTKDPDWDAYLAELISSASSAVYAHTAYISYPNKNIMDSPIQFITNIASLFSYMEEINDEDSDEFGFLSEAFNTGYWFSIGDSYQADERWREIQQYGDDTEKSLINKFEDAVLIASDEGDIDNLNLDNIDYRGMAEWFTKMVQWNESTDTPFDTLLVEMQKLAGVNL